MPTDDLVVRLQAALDETAKLAEPELDGQGQNGSWHTVECGYRQREWQEPCECSVPDAVLRLVQAHRDILAKFDRTKRLLDEANERVLQQVMDGTVATRQEQRDFDSLHVEEAVLAEVIEDLARGYGVEVGR